VALQNSGGGDTKPATTNQSRAKVTTVSIETRVRPIDWGQIW